MSLESEVSERYPGMRSIGKSREAGRAELLAALREDLGLWAFVGVLSVFINLLMLTGPVFTLQVYDRVLASGSVETLAVLFVLVAFLYGVMGVLEHSRDRVGVRIAARFRSRLDRRVFEVTLKRAAAAGDTGGQSTVQDVEAVQKALCSPVLAAVFDIPWTPLLIIGISMFHPWLGGLALAGGGTLVLATAITQRLTQRPANDAVTAGQAAERVVGQTTRNAELVQALGMHEAVFRRWLDAHDEAVRQQMRMADYVGSFASSIKVFRLLLQSAMLGVGAYLVLRGELTGGAMIASSILLGRAMAPVEQLSAQWPLVQRAINGWRNLSGALGCVSPDPVRTKLPRPRPHLDVQNVTVFPPGAEHAVLRALTFRVPPGRAVGIIGPSGAGKSTIAKVLAGAWSPSGGSVRLDGALLDQYAPETLGQLVGYLPQNFQLFEGTIAQNIARMSARPDSRAVVAAAKKAGAHDMILKLPRGYDTRLAEDGGGLSGGQAQRIAFARALYGDPVLLVLDEPNSNLDDTGSAAINKAIRDHKSAGKSVFIAAHRPSAIVECDSLLVLDGGVIRAFGPREAILSTLSGTRGGGAGKVSRAGAK